jgi:hypothetical protein
MADLRDLLAPLGLSQVDRTLDALAGIDPRYQQSYVDLLRALAGAGIDPVAVSGFRTPEEQDALYNSGRGVTGARGGQSYHNYGAALDIVPSAVLSDANWMPDSPLWGQLGEIVGTFPGFEWGGNWTSRYDPSHVQIAGLSIGDLAGGAHAEMPAASTVPQQPTQTPLAPAPAPPSAPVRDTSPIQMPNLPWLDPFAVASTIRSAGRGLIWQDARQPAPSISPLASMFG